MFLPASTRCPHVATDSAAKHEWQAQGDSSDWLYKPASKTFFHTPTETLWRRSYGAPTSLVRVDEAGFTGSTIAVFSNSAVGERLLLRACFSSWEKEVHKFEDMDRDLGNCEEAHMSKPRGSPEGPHRSEALETLPGLFDRVVQLFQPVQRRAADKAPPVPLVVVPLTTATLARHNLQSGLNMRMASFRAASNNDSEGEAMAVVHLERESSWRQHIRNTAATIETSHKIREGDEVLFQGLHRGSVYKVYEGINECEICRAGEVVTNEDGNTRHFSADEITLIRDLPDAVDD